MKKLYTSFLLLLVGITPFSAQTSLLVTNSDNGGSVVTNSMVVYVSTSAGSSTHINFNFKNTSSSSKSYFVTRYSDVRNVVGPGDSAMVYFCTGSNCYTPNTATSPTVGLAAGSSIALIPYLDEASVAGQSSIRYKIYNASDANDYIIFTVAYNNPLSVRTNENIFSAVSAVFPNPVSNKAKINVTTSSDLDNAFVTITNSLGSIVSSKNMDLPSGKSTITLDTENLNSGIYFATIYYNNSSTVKKFIVNK